MISAEFFVYPSGELTGFCIKGHADAGGAGEDIVCAAVSSAAYMVANTITEILHVEAKITVKDDGEMVLCVPVKQVPVCRDVLAGLQLHLTALAEQYPENIFVNHTEV